MKLYRGFDKLHLKEPIAPCAMRNPEKSKMIRFFIDTFGQGEFDYYKTKWDNQPECYKFGKMATNATLCFFLSLVYLSFALKRNEAISLCIEKRQVKNRGFQFSEVYRKTNGEIVADCAHLTENMWLSCCGIVDVPLGNTFSAFDDIFSLACIIPDYSLFQHINYTLRRKDAPCFFPTMVLDWTADFSVACTFAGVHGCVIEIETGIFERELDQEHAKNLLSITQTHFDYKRDRSGKSQLNIISPLIFSYENPLSENNVNIRNQQGVLIFWPWSETVDEMKKSEFGERLQFKYLDLQLV